MTETKQMQSKLIQIKFPHFITNEKCLWNPWKLPTEPQFQHDCSMMACSSSLQKTKRVLTSSVNASNACCMKKTWVLHANRKHIYEQTLLIKKTLLFPWRSILTHVHLVLHPLVLCLSVSMPLTNLHHFLIYALTFSVKHSLVGCLLSH
jgi:hypothetical protein